MGRPDLSFGLCLEQDERRHLKGAQQRNCSYWNESRGAGTKTQTWSERRRYRPIHDVDGVWSAKRVRLTHQAGAGGELGVGEADQQADQDGSG